jgi:hypothetical protein
MFSRILQIGSTRMLRRERHMLAASSSTELTTTIPRFWNNEFLDFYSPDTGIDIDGAWIDMNEPSNVSVADHSYLWLRSDHSFFCNSSAICPATIHFNKRLNRTFLRLELIHLLTPMRLSSRMPARSNSNDVTTFSIRHTQSTMPQAHFLARLPLYVTVQHVFLLGGIIHTFQTTDHGCPR